MLSAWWSSIWHTHYLGQFGKGYFDKGILTSALMDVFQVTPERGQVLSGHQGILLAPSSLASQQSLVLGHRVLVKVFGLSITQMPQNIEVAKLAKHFIKADSYKPKGRDAPSEVTNSHITQHAPYKNEQVTLYESVMALARAGIQIPSRSHLLGDNSTNDGSVDKAGPFISLLPDLIPSSAVNDAPGVTCPEGLPARDPCGPSEALQRSRALSTHQAHHFRLAMGQSVTHSAKNPEAVPWVSLQPS
ncbi:hypothetical protein Anapl_08580 [Anas platyrhynchos]|uniref:Uncharacterized protein n=1 Tax=Anas platyrhynchos TaxID=8839 RepID=R0K9P0_ANAPL|nr:hypothetical protein Anapl_08580 [Anas platyrhynchos]